MKKLLKLPLQIVALFFLGTVTGFIISVPTGLLIRATYPLIPTISRVIPGIRSMRIERHAAMPA